ncbi:MAG: RNA-binding cell elongation regulator Jag/EloR [Anaerolineales bacterium]
MNNRRTSLEIIAPDVDEAVARAEAELHVSADQLDVEVLDTGDPDAGREARVRVLVRDEEPLEMAFAREVLEEILERMQIEATVHTGYAEADDSGRQPPILLDVQGQDLGLLIGRRGETLRALQYLVRVIVTRQLDRQVNLVVDVEGFRSRREMQLNRLAQQMAQQAVMRGQTVSLEPMPANERRIVHLALRDNDDVRTESVGEGNRRKVTIIPNPQSE